jgi:hypothetical protein
MSRSMTIDAPVHDPLQLEFWVGDEAPARRTPGGPPRGEGSTPEPAPRRSRTLLGTFTGLVLGLGLGAGGALALSTPPDPARDVVPPAATRLAVELLGGAPSTVHEGSGPWILRPQDDGGVSVLELGRDEWVVVRRVPPQAGP